MSRRLLGAAALMAAATSASGVELEPEIGMQWHELRERDTAGRVLVREQGWSPRMGLSLSQAWGEDWTLHAGVSGWASRSSYDGQSQGGAALQSHTDTQSVSLQAGLLWRPPPLPVTTQLELGWELERLRRRIAGTGVYGGLDERLTQPRWRLGGAWHGDGGTTIRGALLWGDRAPLSVRFDNGLFDEAHLSSGRARGVAVEASWSLAGAWRMGLNAEVLDLQRSADAPLTHGGAIVGTVSQPRWRRDRVSLLLQRPLGR